jgi:hypothetical protein
MHCTTVIGNAKGLGNWYRLCLVLYYCRIFITDLKATSQLDI